MRLILFLRKDTLPCLKLMSKLFNEFFNIIKDSRKTELPGEKEVANAIREK